MNHVSDADLERLISGLARQDDRRPTWGGLTGYERLTAAHVLRCGGFVVLVRSPGLPLRWWCGPTEPASGWAFDVSHQGVEVAPVAVFATAADAVAAYGDYAARCRRISGLPGEFAVVHMSPWRPRLTRCSPPPDLAAVAVCLLRYGGSCAVLP